MNLIGIDMLTAQTMFVDEDDYVALAIAVEEPEVMLIQTRFDRGPEGRYGYGPTTIMRKPTKQEALERLPYLPRPIRRVGSRRLPPPFGIPFWALDLAEILVEIDPLDRIEG